MTVSRSTCPRHVFLSHINIRFTHILCDGRYACRRVYGITDTLELRVGTEGRVWSTSDAPDTGIRSTEKGNGDASFGLKWHSHDRDPAAYSPAVSWIAQLEAATGDNGFKGDGLRPSLRSVAT